MCQQPAPTTSRIRSVQEGTGKLNIIAYGTKDPETNAFLCSHLDSMPWYITAARINQHPRTYRLRRIAEHRGCYQLVVTHAETYQELAAVNQLLGPMQLSMKGVAKVEYLFVGGGRVTDLDLENDEDVEDYVVIAIGERDRRQYLRTTYSEQYTEAHD